jgi:pimeloyl-ACP methyl ester carboxylesterase
MPTARVNGLNIAYELHGEGEAVAITPGGRMSLETPGLREFAIALAERGKRALIWDRPNTGASDVCFDGELEWYMHADTLAELIATLDLGPTTIFGGSVGAAPSVLTVVRHPEIAKKLAIVWMPGGVFHFANLAGHYYGVNWYAAKHHGMEGVVKLNEDDPGAHPVSLAATLAKNPHNRERMLAMDPEDFAARMEGWGRRVLENLDSPVPGASIEELSSISVPTLIFRSGSKDLNHPRRTNEWVRDVIPDARIVEPPWGDTEFEDRQVEYDQTGYFSHFTSWPKLAPQLLEFIDEPVTAVR